MTSLFLNFLLTSAINTNTNTNFFADVRKNWLKMATWKFLTRKYIPLWLKWGVI